MVMVAVPGERFVMGNVGTYMLYDARPTHTVELSAFWIDQTEVTRAQYQRCVDAGACTPSVNMDSEYPSPAGDEMEKYKDFPVTGVTWHQASGYCTWAGARLPTEAEWEYAARGPQSLTYPWGNDWDDTRLIVPPRGWALTPVGTSPAGISWCGALDMAGSIWEWVYDWYAPYPPDEQRDPQGASSGQEKVVRGGSWMNNSLKTRTDYREHGNPETQSQFIGFRCAKSP
jgi:formylglycine-generating enzyme required for sulfatase activity